MKDKSEFRTGDIPNKPGVYQFFDRFQTVIYVGKAKSLRQRMSSYFQPSRSRTADPRIRSLINSIEYYTFHIVRNEKESLLLESRLIKEYTPRFNVVMRDDKRYPMLRIDLGAAFPRIQLVRLRKDDGATYFGPFPVVGALRDTVDFLTRHFGLRSCVARLPGEDDYRHCHDDIIRRCSAPCIGKITEDAYKSNVDDFLSAVNGHIAPLVEELQTEMTVCAEKHRFERAAKIRDIITNLQKVFGEEVRNFRTSTHKTYAGDAGVADLAQSLKLSVAPKWIECFDISNIMGQFTVASMVCFKRGKPDKAEYRHYRIKTVEGIDDFASMREVVFRRYHRLIEEGLELPDLIVVDGGIGQLNVAMQSMVHLEIHEKVSLASLAKREEEVYVPDRKEPYRLDRHSPALRLLQSIRDEAHRFAITYNRDLRRKRIMDSLLDEIPGVGEKRKHQLLKTFGSVRTMRKHSAEEISRRCPGIGPELAQVIVEHISRKK